MSQQPLSTNGSESFWPMGNIPCNGKSPSRVAVEGHVSYASIPAPAFNRDTGPAMIWSNGSLMYTNRNCEFHRINGAAIIYQDGTREYYVNGKELSPDEFFLRYNTL